MAEIEVLSFSYQYGEISPSSSFGRYHLWLPDGTWQIQVNAAGYQSKIMNVTAASSGNVVDIQLDADVTLTEVQNPRVGGVGDFDLSALVDAGHTYILAASAGTNPGIPWFNIHIPLNPDALFLATINPAGPLVNWQGVVPPDGTI